MTVNLPQNWTIVYSNTQFDCICQRVFFSFSPLISTNPFFALSSTKLSLLARSCPSPPMKHKAERKRWSHITKESDQAVCCFGMSSQIYNQMRRWKVKHGWLTSHNIHWLERCSYKSWRWENVRRRRKWAGEKCQKED